MLFSQRQGLTPAQKTLQLEQVDEELRNRLWNALKVYYWDNYKSSIHGNLKGSNYESFVFSYWHHFFKWSADAIPEHFFQVVDVLREQFFSFPWYRVYDFIEFTIARGSFHHASGFPQTCNQILEQENAGYRIVNAKVTPITSPVEIKSIEDALAEADTFPGAREHLNTALEMISDRENPDYRNSIKESISAVESVCQALVGDKKATLGSALKVLETHTDLHGALKSGLSSIYGYTSDAHGIRHAMLDKSSIGFVDAKFMFVICSAFVNYIIGKVAEIDVKLPVTKGGT